MAVKDKELLGVNYATANYQLHRQLLYAFAEQLDFLRCYRCKDNILSIEEMSIEHKESWRSASEPRTAFFDLTNVCLSHMDCNRRSQVKQKIYDTPKLRKDANNKRYWDKRRNKASSSIG